MRNLLAWVHQPTSVAGISALFGTISAVALHQLSWAQAVPLLAGAVVSILLPDNTGAKDQAQALAGAIVSGVTQEQEK